MIYSHLWIKPVCDSQTFYFLNTQFHTEIQSECEISEELFLDDVCSKIDFSQSLLLH